MNIHLNLRHFRLTDAIHAYANEKLSRLASLGAHVQAVELVLELDEGADPSKRFCARARLDIPGPDLHARAEGRDLYATIDKLASNLARRLRKRKTRFTDKPRRDFQLSGLRLA